MVGLSICPFADFCASLPQPEADVCVVFKSHVRVALPLVLIQIILGLHGLMTHAPAPSALPFGLANAPAFII